MITSVFSQHRIQKANNNSINANSKLTFGSIWSHKNDKARVQDGKLENGDDFGKQKVPDTDEFVKKTTAQQGPDLDKSEQSQPDSKSKISSGSEYQQAVQRRRDMSARMDEARKKGPQAQIKVCNEIIEENLASIDNLDAHKGDARKVAEIFAGDDNIAVKINKGDTVEIPSGEFGKFKKVKALNDVQMNNATYYSLQAIESELDNRNLKATLVEANEHLKTRKVFLELEHQRNEAKKRGGTGVWLNLSDDISPQQLSKAFETVEKLIPLNNKSTGKGTWKNLWGLGSGGVRNLRK